MHLGGACVAFGLYAAALLWRKFGAPRFRRDLSWLVITLLLLTPLALSHKIRFDLHPPTVFVRDVSEQVVDFSAAKFAYRSARRHRQRRVRSYCALCDVGQTELRGVFYREVDRPSQTSESSRRIRRRNTCGFTFPQGSRTSIRRETEVATRPSCENGRLAGDCGAILAYPRIRQSQHCYGLTRSSQKRTGTGLTVVFHSKFGCDSGRRKTYSAVMGKATPIYVPSARLVDHRRRREPYLHRLARHSLCALSK